MSLTIDTWKWVCENYENLKNNSEIEESVHFDTLKKEGIISFENDNFLVADSLVEGVTRIREEEALLKKGAPLSFKQTFVNFKELQRHLWLRGKTQERKTFLTNYELVLFSDNFKRLTVMDSLELLGVELIISQVRRAVFREEYVELVPSFLQRETYFSSGVIGFEGEDKHRVCIDEGYYDLLTHFWVKVKTPCRFISLFVGKELVVVLNPHVGSRYLEDIIAIISPCELKDT
jgi:hypothetical protein